MPSHQTTVNDAMRRMMTIVVFSIMLVSSVFAQVTSDYSIRVSDGVVLDASLMLPATGAPLTGFPVVVLVHGYGGNKDNWTGVESYLVGLGYGSFTYSVRGQGNSGGLSTTMGERERADLLEVIQFLRALPGVDPERLAVAGGSQGGIHAWMAATQNMPGVRAIASLIGPPSFAHDLLPNGCIKQQLWAELNLSGVRYDPVRDRLRDLVIGDQYDSVAAYINSRDLEGLLDSVRIPVFQSLGWADVLFPTNGAIRALKRLASRGVPVWSYFGTNGHGELNLAEYYFVIMNLIAPWFNRWLKGDSLANANLPFVVYADNRPTWPHHESVGWPPSGSGSLRLYFADGERLSASPAELSGATFTMTYDPAYTTAQGWTDGYSGTGFTSAFHAGPARFLSAPLADSAEVTGVTTGLLELRSEAAMFQAHVRIFDVTPAPNGDTWTIITRGPMGIRNNIPGATIQRTVECNALSHIIPSGHRIGVEVTSLDMYDSNRPHIVPYFNSSTSVVSSSFAAPSYVDLPVVGDVTFASVPLAEAGVPAGFELSQNYPNPFNPSTSIGYRVQGSGDRVVRLVVYDLLGREVTVLVDELKEAGSYEVTWNARGLASGAYICRMTAGTFTQARRMLLVK
jgi:predicted acyl esterase